jgi:hypothetical protein
MNVPPSAEFEMYITVLDVAYIVSPRAPREEKRPSAARSGVGELASGPGAGGA